MTPVTYRTVTSGLEHRSARTMEPQPCDNRNVPPGSLPPPQARRERRILEVDNSKEAAAYRMLRQVLHNHLTTQDLTLLSALTAVGRVLGHLARHLHGMGYDRQRFSKDTRAEQQLTPVGARWIALHLAADVLYGVERLLHPALGPDEIEEIMDWFQRVFVPQLTA